MHASAFTDTGRQLQTSSLFWGKFEQKQQTLGIVPILPGFCLRSS